MGKIKLLLIILSSAVSGIVLFLAAIYGYSYFKFKSYDDNQKISTPTVFGKENVKERYLGSVGVTAGRFDWKNQKNLAPGQGKIKGHILKHGSPCPGIKIQILFNENLISESAASDENGVYFINVPYGVYRIDGWKIDHETADKFLAGKILEPELQFISNTITVSENILAKGPSLNFIDPIKILKPLGIVTYTENVEIEWSKVEVANSYRVQIIDRGDNLRGSEYKPLFRTYNDWPSTSNTTIKTKEMGINLDPGHFYTLEVHALNNNNRSISESPNRHEDGFFLQRKLQF
jgi:hypothetical protein